MPKKKEEKKPTILKLPSYEDIEVTDEEEEEEVEKVKVTSTPKLMMADNLMVGTAIMENHGMEWIKYIRDEMVSKCLKELKAEYREYKELIYSSQPDYNSGIKQSSFIGMIQLLEKDIADIDQAIHSYNNKVEYDQIPGWVENTIRGKITEKISKLF